MKIIAILISILFIVLAALHIFVDEITIDVIAIVLLALASFPWMLPHLKSLELPGGVKIELKDVQIAIEKVSGKDGQALTDSSDYEYLKIISAHDPNLALVAIRIEIEKAVRFSLGSDGRPISLSRAIRKLVLDGIITQDIANGLNELIKFGNHAAHGVEVDSLAAEYAIDNAARILKPFKELINNTPPPFDTEFG